MKVPVVGLTAVVLFVFGCSDSDDGIGPDVPLQILSRTPSANATSAGASDDLIVVFDRPLDSSTVSDGDVRVLGRWSGVLTGSVTLSDGDRELRFSPARPLSAGESVTVTIPRGSVRGADSAEMLHGFTWTFWVAVAPTSMTFEEVSTVEVRHLGEEHIQTYGLRGGPRWGRMVGHGHAERGIERSAGFHERRYRWIWSLHSGSCPPGRPAEHERGCGLRR